MKKTLLFILALCVAVVLTACGKDKTDKKDSASSSKKIIVAATSVPHAEILEKAKPILKEKGYDLEVKVFDDYILPNKVLDEKEVDANYFQHIPYLESQIKDNGYKFVNAGGIHIEPIGIYSKKYKSIEDLPKGAKIIVSSSVADHGRVLGLFEAKGLIKLKDGVDKTKAQLTDIVENKKDFKFESTYKAEVLPSIYQNGEGDAVVINSNFALGAGLNPIKDAIALEDSASPYVNIIAVNKGDENKAKIKTLVEVLQSKEIQDWIISKYGGSVVPVK